MAHSGKQTGTSGTSSTRRQAKLKRATPARATAKKSTKAAKASRATGKKSTKAAKAKKSTKAARSSAKNSAAKNRATPVTSGDGSKKPAKRGAARKTSKAVKKASVKKIEARRLTKSSVKKTASASQKKTSRGAQVKVTTRPSSEQRASSPANRQLFTSEAIAFLVELRSNNERDWFKANQDRYEAVVREPARAFIRQMAPLLQKLSPHFVACDKKVGGSMMRPQRDTRFAANKEPYKTNVGIHFRHAAGKDVHAPGLYFHFDPEEAFLGAGIWRPEPEVLLKLRRRIANAPKEWAKAVGGRTFRDTFSFGGDSLKRPPRGFDPDHPLIETLKRKDFIAVQQFDHAQLCSGELTHGVYKRFRAALPFTKFLAQAIGLPL